MEERTYPREWFRVHRLSTESEPQIFVRETSHRLYFPGDNQRYEMKTSSWVTWYPTKEAAQAVLDQRASNKAQRVADNLVRDAAQDLLAALEECVSVVKNHHGNALALMSALVQAEDAITKAKPLATNDTSCNKPSGEAVTENDLPY